MKDFVASTAALILNPFTFVNPAVLVDENSETVSLPLLVYLTAVDAVFVLLDTELFRLPESFVIELI